MKTLILMCLLLALSSLAAADEHASIVIHPTATVSGDTFVLADIATITSSNTAFRTQLMSVPMGRAPLSGLTRPFNEGDVCLKLRQAGIDPDTLSISGADELVVTGSGSAQSSSPSQYPSLPLSQAAPATAIPALTPPGEVLIHSGDKVTLVYDADGMVISADVVAASSGAVGQTITLRRDGAAHLLQGIVQDAQTVKMME